MWNSRSSVVHWLWTNNPFYFISALLMLYAVRASYGHLEIGAINCWLMMGVLAVYTSVLAALGVAIVRWGKVWDDARSIFLLLLLLFLAVSVSADDLFVNMESQGGAVALLGFGLAFSIIVFQCVLRGAGIRLGAAFQIPFLLFLALFYATPWWCSPELHPRDPQSLDWTVFLFPQVAALLCLTLLPAVRQGRSYFANNGTPWPWPWFPWMAFGFIGFAVVLRSYALSLTFSQTGPIWLSANERSGIVLDTIWRPYFIAPFLLAVLLLILEAGLASGNRRLVRRVMLTTPLLVLLAWPWGNTTTSVEFVSRLTDLAGSPVWLMTLLVIVFYGWTMLRKVPHSLIGLLGTLLILSFVGPETIDLTTFVLQPIPLFAVSLILVILGVVRSSTALSLAATAVMAWGLWVILPETLLVGYRATICYHVVMIASLALSLVFKDRLALLLQSVNAWWLAISSLMVMSLPVGSDVPTHWRLLYVSVLAGLCLLCAQVSRNRSYWAGFVGTTSVLGYSLGAVGFRAAVAVVGRSAMTAFSWSIGTLLIGALISAYKAGWLNSVIKPAWIGMEGLGDDSKPPSDGSEEPEKTEG